MSVPESDIQKYQEFSEYLLLDLKNSLNEIDNRKIRTIFFGGGTPSLINPKSVENIVDFIAKNYKTDSKIEITLEANPATFDENKLKALKTAGVNRLSLGVQSFQDKNLKFLRRIYDSNQAMKSAEIISKNFSNFSFDFIYGYDSQTLQDLEQDLSLAIDFACKHISCYQLTIEEGTSFFELNKQKEIIFRDDKSIKFFRFIKSFLKKFSMSRYEISNYSKKGFESKHNLAYWRYKDYLGVGPSAHTRLSIHGSKIELKKIYDPYEWRAKILSGESTFEVKNNLTDQEQLEEIFIVGFRLSEGINLEDLQKKFSANLLNPIWEKIKILSDKNFIKFGSDKIKLTAEGYLKMNSVVEFLFS